MKEYNITDNELMNEVLMLCSKNLPKGSFKKGMLSNSLSIEDAYDDKFSRILKKAQERLEIKGKDEEQEPEEPEDGQEDA